MASSRLMRSSCAIPSPMLGLVWQHRISCGHLQQQQSHPRADCRFGATHSLGEQQNSTCAAGLRLCHTSAVSKQTSSWGGSCASASTALPPYGGSDIGRDAWCLQGGRRAGRVAAAGDDAAGSAASSDRLTLLSSQQQGQQSAQRELRRQPGWQQPRVQAQQPEQQQQQYSSIARSNAGIQQAQQQQQQQLQQQQLIGRGWSQQPQQPWQAQQASWGHQHVDTGFADEPVYPQPTFITRYVRRHKTAWYQGPQYMNPAALHAQILERSGRGLLEVGALTHLVRTAGSSKDAQLALSALSAVRAVAVSLGHMEPWPDRFTKAFVKMTALCDAHDVLLSALQRPNELGFVFKWKTLLVALKHWGDSLAVDKLEQIAFLMKDAGLKPDQRMAYVVIRACVNSGQYQRAQEVLRWFKAEGVMQYKPALETLLQKAAAGAAAEATGQVQAQEELEWE